MLGGISRVSTVSDDRMSEPYNLRLKESHKAELEALAEKNERNLAQEIRLAVRFYLDAMREKA